MRSSLSSLNAFRTGTRWGDLTYDLAIAYIGAYVFYLLVARLPPLRDRADVCQGIEPLLWRVFAESRGLIRELNRMAHIGSLTNTVSTTLEAARLTRL
jgi:hypothetical protein